MPVTQKDLEEIRKRQQEASSKASKYAGLSSVFIDRVKEELRKRAAQRGASQLAEQEAAARKEFVAAPAQQREEYVGVTPGVRQQLVAERRGDIFSELAKIEDMRRAREASIQDILGVGERGVQAEAMRAGIEQASVQQAYENMFGEYQAQVAAEQFARQQQLAEQAQAALEAYRNAQLAISGLEAGGTKETPQEKLARLMWQHRGAVTGSGEAGKSTREEFMQFAQSQVPEISPEQLAQSVYSYPQWAETRELDEELAYQSDLQDALSVLRQRPDIYMQLRADFIKDHPGRIEQFDEAVKSVIPADMLLQQTVMPGI